jgi:tetratricopeptide (TPR) repeat protein
MADEVAAEPMAVAPEGTTPVAEEAKPVDPLSGEAGLEGSTLDESGLYIAADGRRQAVDDFGNPLFDADGYPLWEALPAERAKQMFEEAMMLRKGVAGGERDLMGAAMRLNEALSLVPTFVEARYNLALVQLDQDLIKEAVQSLKTVLEARPDWKQAILSLAISHERAGDFAAATKIYSKGLDSEPENVDMLNGMARIYRKMGESELAVEKAKAILKIDSNSIDAYNTLGLAYLAMSELELARFVFLKAEKSVPGADENSAIQANLGLVNYRFAGWSKDKREFEATDRFEKALALNADDLGAMVNLAHLKLINFDFDGARELLERAHRKMPANVPIQLNLAVARRGTGEYDGAEKLYNQIASVPGEYRADALINLAILQGDFRKDYPTAIETYNEYLSVMSEAGEVVAEDDPVRGYITSIEKILERAEKKRQRAADKAKRNAERDARRKAKEEAAAAEAAAAEAAAAEAAAAEAAAAEAAPADSQPTETAPVGEDNGGAVPLPEAEPGEDTAPEAGEESDAGADVEAG